VTYAPVRLRGRRSVGARLARVWPRLAVLFTWWREAQGGTPSPARCIRLRPAVAKAFARLRRDESPHQTVSGAEFRFGSDDL